MKSNSLNFRFYATALLAANLAGAPILIAADPPPATPAPPPPGGTGAPGRPGGTGGGGGGGRGGDRGDRNSERFQARGPVLGLDEKQRELFREASQKDSDEVRQLEEKLRSAQKELMHVVLGEKYDDKAVREKAEAVSKIQSEITVLRAKALASVAPTLKPEQREQLENSPMGTALLGGAFSGFRGTGGFGGQGAPDGYRGPRGGGGAGGGAPPQPRQ